MRASAIRYVHLPPTADPVSTVKRHRKRIDVARRENYTRQQRESMRSGSRHGESATVRPVAFQATIPIYIIVTVIKISLISARWRKRVAL
eukprot:jgi/Picre1/30385/NNA_005749.t1